MGGPSMEGVGPKEKNIPESALAPTGWGGES